MPRTEADKRVLIFAPIGRDAAASANLLRTGNIDAEVCRDLAELEAEVKRGVACVFVAEEALFGQDTTPLTHWIEQQEPWSDLPFVVLSSHHDQPAVIEWRRKLIGALRNVSLLERPIQPITLTSSIQSALRARARQYEVRDLLGAQQRAAQDLERLVMDRTHALEKANAELRKQMAERTRVEEALRQAQKIEAIGQLTGGVAHDFNNLLMVISGGLEMLERHTDPVRRRRVMSGMQQAAERGTALTRQLLAFSRRQPLNPQPIDLARQVGGMRELLERSLRGDVHMVLDLPEDLWPVEVDPGELELVLLNLAVNARDAMPNGGTITVRAHNVRAQENEQKTGDCVSLTVSDTGTGMRPEVKERVFEPFYTTKDVGRGSGLGLAQVHGFATQSGGTVRIVSEWGHGSTINIQLPRSHKEPAPDERHLVELHVPARQPTVSGSVLLVEDDDEVAELVSQMLDQLGYDVTRASNARAALGALANGRKIDIVFSDIMMPGGMNGLDLVRAIRARQLELPILLTSGYSEAAARDAEAEGVRILPKPYRLEELSQALAMAAGSASARH